MSVNLTIKGDKSAVLRAVDVVSIGRVENRTFHMRLFKMYPLKGLIVLVMLQQLQLLPLHPQQLLSLQPLLLPQQQQQLLPPQLLLQQQLPQA